ncbi:MAG: Transferase hexapeptide repeat containing protein [Candidatus Gottesmanbacteria bacterium GW2011_GWC2_39_8]|uniref:Transferase hexapeptide repeat containing protein n=1 Tax=Candidatus Gottesmanbacteria bacterium GW2011_GWC2_39_8 TaxID=1618450 RepID=A0A0G0T4U9_9BACT|nr:MAG: Transferase hexapeptide repeat containing protein [Candidatus Gottesmanbacteria bacterium GW2011_GWC2_39_8]
MSVKKDVKLGKNVKIYHPELVNLYGCEIGDETTIGAFVEIKPDVKIGKRVKIQAGAFIPEGIIIEDEVFIGPHVCFVNDIFPRATNDDGTLKAVCDWKVKKTVIKKKASIGANATILCGVTVGEGAMIGAGSVVTKDVPDWTVVAGNPAREIRKIK